MPSSSKATSPAEAAMTRTVLSGGSLSVDEAADRRLGDQCRVERALAELARAGGDRPRPPGAWRGRVARRRSSCASDANRRSSASVRALASRVAASAASVARCFAAAAFASARRRWTTAMPRPRRRRPRAPRARRPPLPPRRGLCGPDAASAQEGRLDRCQVLRVAARPLGRRLRGGRRGRARLHSRPCAPQAVAAPVRWRWTRRPSRSSSTQDRSRGHWRMSASCATSTVGSRVTGSTSNVSSRAAP